MKNLAYLYEIASICCDKLDNIGIEYGCIQSFSINTRAKKRFGQCCRKNGVYTINISSMLLQENIPQKNLETVIMHEIIHTCPNCFNHKSEWKAIAEKVNAAYGYHISRTTSYEEMGISKEDRPQKRVKYIVACDGKCNRSQSFGRMTDFVNYVKNSPNGLKCSKCKGHIRLVYSKG